MFHPGQTWVPQLLRCFSDLGSFFWRSAVPDNLFAYKPFWGGYLNPVLTSFFLMGVLELWRFRSRSLVQGMALAFVVFILPGCLTGGVEMFRVVTVLPLVMVPVGTGFTIFVMSLKPKLRLMGLTVLAVASMGLDSYHLFGVYHEIWTHPQGNWFASKSVERLRAYSILQELQVQEGPGYVLSELVPDIYDQSLSVATYNFNAVENTALSQAKWTALIANIHYLPYLAAEFPEGKWIGLAPDVERPDGGLMLGIIPLPSAHPRLLNRWLQAKRAVHSTVAEVFENRDYRPRKPVLESLEKLYPLFKGDRFLESCFWEKIAENQYGDRNYEAQIAALQQALKRGYPTAHLYNNLGALLLRRSHFAEAKKAFLQAVHSPFNHTSAAAGLNALAEIQKTQKFPPE
jgi:hypothetical protein